MVIKVYIYIKERTFCLFVCFVFTPRRYPRARHPSDADLVQIFAADSRSRLVVVVVVVAVVVVVVVVLLPVIVVVVFFLKWRVFRV